MKNILLMMGVLCLIISCNTAVENQSATGNTDDYQIENKQPDVAAQHATEPAAAKGNAETASSAVVYNGNNLNNDWDKKIIKIANVHAECTEYKTYNQQVHVLARQFGGWIASESETQQDARINNTVTIKVPVPQFDELMLAINNLDGKTIEKTIATQDVTANMVEVKGRIAVRREMRDKYLDLLHDTKKIDDALKIQRELNDMHENIEMASNQLQSMQVQTAFSTINLNYYQLLPLANEPAEESKPGFGRRMVDAVSGGGIWLLDVAIGMAAIWPFWLGITLLVFYLRRKKFFRNKNPLTTS